MANLDSLFKQFDNELNVLKTKKDKMILSRKNLREKIKGYFSIHHENYIPMFYIQGSYKLKTMIRTKEDTCDMDDGVYFEKNPDNVTGTTLQQWVKNAVDGTTDATPIHKKKCIRVDYKAGYNIDLPVFVFDKKKEAHPNLAVKNSDFQKTIQKNLWTTLNKERQNRWLELLDT
ncbi:MAG: cyclic GMP-AMP synthase DncV-like nucleotidyltransferase [Fermentimonas sp.]